MGDNSIYTSERLVQVEVSMLNVQSAMSCTPTCLGEAEELHVIRTPDRYSVSNILSIYTLDTCTIGSLGVATLRGIVLDALRLVVVVAEDARPLLHRLLVVLRAEGGVDAAMVDLHLGARAGVTRVHVGDDLGPSLGCSNRFTLGTGAVPGVNRTRC